MPTEKKKLEESRAALDEQQRQIEEGLLQAQNGITAIDAQITELNAQIPQIEARYPAGSRGRGTASCTAAGIDCSPGTARETVSCRRGQQQWMKQ